MVNNNLMCCRRRDNAIYDFSKKAVENGLDIFRVFDSLNYFGVYLHFGLSSANPTYTHITVTQTT